jgi:hypothetical protein
MAWSQLLRQCRGLINTAYSQVVCMANYLVTITIMQRVNQGFEPCSHTIYIGMSQFLIRFKATNIGPQGMETKA